MTEAKENGEPLSPVDPLDVEFALIIRGNPRINKHGIKKYRREDIEIVNTGKPEPLPRSFIVRKGDRCPTIKSK